MHDKHRVHRHQQPNEQTVQKRLVIGYDQGARIVENFRIPNALYPEQDFQQRAQNGFEHGFWLSCDGQAGGGVVCIQRESGAEAGSAGRIGVMTQGV